MKRIVIAVLVLAFVACKSSDVAAPVADPGATFIGTWDLVSVNGVAAPAHATVAGDSETVTLRTFTIERQSTGLGDIEGMAVWNDSTVWAQCGPGLPARTCDASGTATGLLWTLSTNADSITVFRDPGLTIQTGTIVASRTFVLQSDGSLLETDDAESDVYKKP